MAEMIAFMDDHRGEHGVEPMCRVLNIAPSTWHEHAARQARPGLRPRRAKEDERPCAAILRVHAENFGVYGVRKVWWQLLREGFDVGRDRVARSMRRLGLEGVRRGRRVKTTVSDKSACVRSTRSTADSLPTGRTGPSRASWPCLFQRSDRRPPGLRWQKRSSASTRPR